VDTTTWINSPVVVRPAAKAELASLVAEPLAHILAEFSRQLWQHGVLAVLQLAQATMVKAAETACKVFALYTNINKDRE
jgi:hypothetical protein